MNIQGLTKTTLLDYPGLVACTIFTGGCNMQCRFCQNYELVSAISESEISEEELLKFLDKRRTVLSGVCISGGEPTLQPDLPELLMKIRQYGYLIKIDTNGLKPQVVEKLIDLSLVDMFSVDIKSSFRGYKRICNVEPEKAAMVRDTLKIISDRNIKAELRTTVCEGIHNEQDFREIGEWLLGIDMPYYLQAFKKSEYVPDKSIMEPSVERLRSYVKVLLNYFSNVYIRGISLDI